MAFGKKKEGSFNHRVMIVKDGSVTFSPARQCDKGMIECEHDILPETDAKKFYDQDNGCILYVYNLDIPAKVESEKLKDLRRSVALNRIFNYDKEKPFNWFGLLPYVIAIIAIMSK